MYFGLCCFWEFAEILDISMTVCSNFSFVQNKIAADLSYFQNIYFQNALEMQFIIVLML